MKPQNIVYLGLVLVGIGVSICAIDPLKPLPDSFGLYVKDYFEQPVILEQSEFHKKELIADNVIRETFYPNDEPNQDFVIEGHSINREFFELDITTIPDSAFISELSSDWFAVGISFDPTYSSNNPIIENYVPIKVKLAVLLIPTFGLLAFIITLWIIILDPKNIKGLQSTADGSKK